MSNSDNESGKEGDGRESTGIVEEWKHITKPGPHDVLCGRGGGTNNHQGNVKFRKTINEFKLRYLAVSKVEKPKIAREVVKLWRNLDPPGRFLARKDDSRKGPGSVKAEGNVWFDIGDKKAREKASQCLRERTPDVLPFVREMQRRQDLLTGQALNMVEQEMRLRSINQQANLEARANEFNQYTSSNRDGVVINCYPSAASLRSIEKPNVNTIFSANNFVTDAFQNAPTSNFNCIDRSTFQQIAQGSHLFQPGLSSFSPSQAQVFSGGGTGLLEPVPLPSDRKVACFKPDAITSTVSSSGKKGRRNMVGGNTLEEHIELGCETRLSTQKNTLEHVDISKRKKESKKARIKNTDVAERKDQSTNHTGRSIRTHFSGSNANKSAISNISGITSKSGLSNISQQSVMSATTLFSEMTGISRRSQMSTIDGSLSVMSDFTALTDLSGTLGTLDLKADAKPKS